MTNRTDSNDPTLLERIDLMLAERLCARPIGPDPVATVQGVLDHLRRADAGDAALVAALLRLRGFIVVDEDAAAVLTGRASRLSPITQEHRLIVGLARCLVAIRRRAADGELPDGAFLLELFRTMTADLPRFRNNDVRRGQPWDALLYVSYPAADQLRPILASFDAEHCYRDLPPIWHAMHPVRQGFRLLWRFARIAPFPDFNLIVAWLGMNAWLLAKGFPMLTPAAGDRELLARLLGGPPPTRIVQYEARLLERLAA